MNIYVTNNIIIYNLNTWNYLVTVFCKNYESEINLLFGLLGEFSFKGLDIWVGVEERTHLSLFCMSHFTFMQVWSGILKYSD